MNFAHNKRYVLELEVTMPNDHKLAAEILVDGSYLVLAGIAGAAVVAWENIAHNDHGRVFDKTGAEMAILGPSCHLRVCNVREHTP